LDYSGAVARPTISFCKGLLVVSHLLIGYKEVVRRV